MFKRFYLLGHGMTAATVCASGVAACEEPSRLLLGEPALDLEGRDLDLEGCYAFRLQAPGFVGAVAGLALHLAPEWPEGKLLGLAG